MPLADIPKKIESIHQQCLETSTRLPTQGVGTPRVQEPDAEEARHLHMRSADSSDVTSKS